MLGQLVAFIGGGFLNEHAFFTAMYNSPIKRFGMVLGSAALIGLLVGLALGYNVNEGVGFGCGILSAIILLFVFKSAFSTYREKFIACPKCGQETKITKDDLLSENVISERTKGGNKKIRVNHYRVGTRLVTIACESCDYAEARELKFKEKA